MILPPARSPHEIFEEFKARRLSIRWTGYWRERCAKQLNLYYSLKWHLIPIAKHHKEPLRSETWAEKDYDFKQDVALRMVLDQFNIGVVAGLSGLVLLDCDTAEIPDALASLIPSTMTMRTPRGYAFFTLAPFESKLYQKFKKKYPAFDKPRRGIMYSLVPPSKTCTRSSREGDKCDAHDYKVREWISDAMKPRPFADFIEDAISVG